VRGLCVYVRTHACACMHMRACMFVCMRARLRACVRVRVRAMEACDRCGTRAHACMRVAWCLVEYPSPPSTSDPPDSQSMGQPSTHCLQGGQGGGAQEGQAGGGRGRVRRAHGEPRIPHLCIIPTSLPTTGHPPPRLSARMREGRIGKRGSRVEGWTTGLSPPAPAYPQVGLDAYS
jgi:hypothetical protein